MDIETVCFVTIKEEGKVIKNICHFEINVKRLTYFLVLVLVDFVVGYVCFFPTDKPGLISKSYHRWTISGCEETIF